MHLDALIAVLRLAHERSWSADTALHPEQWSAQNPAQDHCVVSALSTQKLLGGSIVNAVACLPSGVEVSHYWNVIRYQDVDFTRGQFPGGTHIPAGTPKLKGYSSTREYVLSNQNTADRFAVYHPRVLSALERLGALDLFITRPWRS